MAQRPEELVYSVDERPPFGRLVVLGIQYAILASMSLVLLVIFCRDIGLSEADSRTIIGLGLFALAIGAAVQAYRGRFFGSGYLALPAFSAIYLGPAIMAGKIGGLPLVAGMTIFAGLVEIAMSQLLPRLRVLIQPMISGLIILMVGIELGIIAMGHLLDVPEEGRPDFLPHVAVAVLTFFTAVSLSIWGSGPARLMCSLIALIVGIVAALAVGLIGPTELAALADAPWLAVPDMGIVSYDFDVSVIPVFLAAGLAAAIRSTGVFATAQRANDTAWKRPDVPNLQRGVFGDGIGAVAAGLSGAIGSSVAPSMVGMSVVTGATSRVIAFATAGFLVLFGFIPRIAAAFVHLPLEIVGGLLLFNASLMIAGGIQVITLQRLDTRATIVVAVSLVLGLMTLVQPAYFAHLPGELRTIAGSTLTITIAAAIALTLIFRIGIRRREGLPWPSPDGSVSDLKTLIEKESHAWHVADDVADRAKDAVAQLVDRLHQSDVLDEPRRITSTFDELELRIEVAYLGRPVHLPTATHHTATQHEESAAVAIPVAIAADRTSVSTKGQEITIQLAFTA